MVREVELVPRRGWGGEGALGAELGYGALHRLPVPLTEEVQGPGESLFDASPAGIFNEKSSFGMDSSQYLVPANTIASPPPPPMVSPNAPPITAAPGVASRSKKTRHAAASPNRAFDDYFKESEAKSKEVDYTPSRKGTPSAPPPKLGAPPPSQTLEVEGEPGPAEETVT